MFVNTKKDSRIFNIWKTWLFIHMNQFDQINAQLQPGLFFKTFLTEGDFHVNTFSTTLDVILQWISCKLY